MPFGCLSCAPTSGKHRIAAFFFLPNLVVTASCIVSLSYIKESKILAHLLTRSVCRRVTKSNLTENNFFQL